MACHCSNCSKSKQIGAYRQLQCEKPVRQAGASYPKKSRKIWEDRINHERKELINSQARLVEAKERAKEVKRQNAYLFDWKTDWEEESVKYHLKRIESIKKEAERQGIVLA